MYTNELENLIRDKLADDVLISGTIEEDDSFEHLMALIGNTIDEWLASPIGARATNKVRNEI